MQPGWETSARPIWVCEGNEKQGVVESAGYMKGLRRSVWPPGGAVACSTLACLAQGPGGVRRGSGKEEGLGLSSGN